MQRRNFLRLLGGAAMASAMGHNWLNPGRAMAQVIAPYSGPILLTFHARGGWDHGSFSDPRENPLINHWADTLPAGVAGNLRYAPMAENQSFFDKYHQHMLVINGIDIQSGAHGSASRNRTSGRLTEGYPQLNELFAAVNGNGMPLAFVNANGYAIEPIGLAARSALPSESTLRTLAAPNSDGRGGSYVRPADFDVVRRYQAQRLTRLAARSNNLPRWQNQIDALAAARDGAGGMDALAGSLPGGGLDRNDLTGARHNMVSQLHMFLVTAAAGLTTTATFGSGGWDSHSDSDASQASALTSMTRALDYLWSKAETLGIANRLVVHITSDVGRTVFYNARDGKDHKSSSSDIVMMKNAPWGDRTVGASGPQHEKLAINPTTLALDPNGIRLQPRHIQSELRKLLGLDSHPLTQGFPLDAAPVNLFDPSVETGISV